MFGNRKDRMPNFVYPELATPGAAPKGDDWLHEIKFDGYRILTFLKNKRIKLMSRNENEWTSKFPTITKQLLTIPANNVILDGELVVLDKKGISRFQLLQNYLEINISAKINYYIFDILFLDDKNLMYLPLIERKHILASVFKKWRKKNKDIYFSNYIIGNGEFLHKKACQVGLEGIVCKKIDSTYQSKRTRDWIKAKCVHRQEFVIGGYTDPKGARSKFGALLLGVYEGKKLIFCGHVGTGFNEKTLNMLYKKLKKIEQAKPVFFKVPRFRDVHWVKPELVAEISFLEWTSDGILRQAVFQGLREDKKAKNVVYEPFNPKSLS